MLYYLFTDNSCSPSNCSNGATCVPRSNGYDCICSNGFTGNRCQTSEYLFVIFLTVN